MIFNEFDTPIKTYNIPIIIMDQASFYKMGNFINKIPDEDTSFDYYKVPKTTYLEFIKKVSLKESYDTLGSNNGTTIVTLFTNKTGGIETTLSNNITQSHIKSITDMIPTGIYYVDKDDKGDKADQHDKIVLIQCHGLPSLGTTWEITNTKDESLSDNECSIYTPWTCARLSHDTKWQTHEAWLLKYSECDYPIILRGHDHDSPILKYTTRDILRTTYNPAPPPETDSRKYYKYPMFTDEIDKEIKITKYITDDPTDDQNNNNIFPIDLQKQPIIYTHSSCGRTGGYQDLRHQLQPNYIDKLLKPGIGYTKYINLLNGTQTQLFVYISNLSYYNTTEADRQYVDNITHNDPIIINSTINKKKLIKINNLSYKWFMTYKRTPDYKMSPIFTSKFWILIYKKLQKLKTKQIRVIENQQFNCGIKIQENEIDKVQIVNKHILDGKNIIVVGDIHGDLHAIIDIIRFWITTKIINDDLVITGNDIIMFTGDFVSRGIYGPEVLAIVLYMYTLEDNENKIFITHGNHESNYDVWETHGFIRDLKARAESNIYNTLT